MRRLLRTVGAIIAPALIAASTSAPATAQPSASRTPTSPPAAPPAPYATSAVRATKAPVIDGREDDDVWKAITPTRNFRQYDPSEDAPTAFETEFRVAYDDHNLYALVRAFDPHPDSIQRLLSRRDVKTNSDQIEILIDGFLDRRNAMQFIVNPAGVKRDGVYYNDVTGDMSWDGVWEAAVQVDEKGWVAEFRIPFSQLRFSNAESHTFGFAVSREIARLNEKDAWPLYRRSASRVVSQFGTIDGIHGVPPTRRVEILPYAVTKSVPDAAAPGRANRTEFSAGLDTKVGLGSNLTLDATINPDFGQVEADPAVLNLTAFETRFDERRTFFQEGIGLFRCGSPCDGPFYTRRIGRTPQLRSSSGDAAFTPILGAAKLTGRLNSGFTVAALDAVTGEVRGTTGATIEPQTNYFVARIARASDDGSRQVGLLMGDTRRRLDVRTDSLLRRSASMALIQGSTRFAHDRYELMAYTGQSYVIGSAAAMALTQRSSVHYFQRPDGEEAYDPTRTSMLGGAIGGSIKKLRGAVRFETFLRHSKPEQEMNDLGLVPTVNDVSIRQTVDYQPTSSTKWFRSSFTQLSAETHWTTSWLPVARSVALHTSASLYNNWAGALTATTWDFGGMNCVSCARGGPALRQAAKSMLRLDLLGDGRRAVQPTLTAIFTRGDDGGTGSSEVDAGLTVRVASQFSASLTAGYSFGSNDQQWVANYGAFLSDTTHYTFARLDQQTFTVVTRVNWTATPTVSFQVYGQPFVSSGAYSNWRQLGAPRAPDYPDRFRPYGSGLSPAGFNVKQFNSNAVMRWEYRPGSALFVIWQQGRFQDAVNQGTFDGQRDMRDLFAAPPQNTILVKYSYWFNP